MTTQTPAIVASPEWPRDIHGFTSSLRREVARTIGRIQGNEDKFEIFLAHLKAAEDWATSRMQVHQTIMAERVAAVEARTAKEAEIRGKTDDLAVAQGSESDDERRASQYAAGIGSAAPVGKRSKKGA